MKREKRGPAHKYPKNQGGRGKMQAQSVLVWAPGGRCKLEDPEKSQISETPPRRRDGGEETQ